MSNYNFTKSSGEENQMKDLMFIAELTEGEAETINGGQGLAVATSFNSPKKTNPKRDIVLHHWTAACYREFGPDAKWPDSELLKKCLD